jgi:hypothetical protein
MSLIGHIGPIGPILLITRTLITPHCFYLSDINRQISAAANCQRLFEMTCRNSQHCERPYFSDYLNAFYHGTDFVRYIVDGFALVASNRVERGPWREIHKVSFLKELDF